jgi:DNA-binding PadR family transcriptional regulator
VLVVPAAVAVLQELDASPGWADGLRTRVEARLGGNVPVYRSHVTQALAMLEKEGLAEATGHERRPGGAGSPRRVYAITKRGREEAARHRATAAAFWGYAVQAEDRAAAPERIVVLDEEDGG